jgi:hypothetical protein
LNCTRPNSPSSATHAYAASVWRNNCAKHISSLRYIDDICAPSVYFYADVIMMYYAISFGVMKSANLVCGQSGVLTCVRVHANSSLFVHRTFLT